MAMLKQHRILIATDGSRPAQAAPATAVKFSWSASSHVRAVIARSNWLPADSEPARVAVEKIFEAAAAAARRALAPRWPESKVVVIDALPVDAILAEAERFKASLLKAVEEHRADVLVLGCPRNCGGGALAARQRRKRRFGPLACSRAARARLVLRASAARCASIGGADSA